MAQGTVTKIPLTISGRRHLIFSFAETSAGTTSEWTLDCSPFTVATLVKYKATLTAGSGATINPKLGLATSWTANTQNDVGTNTSTAAHIDDESRVVINFGGSGATLYGVSQVDTGSDNAISTLVILAEGAEP